jgi:hypothetical protein
MIWWIIGGIILNFWVNLQIAMWLGGRPSCKRYDELLYLMASFLLVIGTVWLGWFAYQDWLYVRSPEYAEVLERKRKFQEKRQKQLDEWEADRLRRERGEWNTEELEDMRLNKKFAEKQFEIAEYLEKTRK